MKNGTWLFLGVVALFAVRAAAQPVMSINITNPSTGTHFAECSEIVVTVDPQIQGGDIKNVSLYRNEVAVTAKTKAPWEFTLKNSPSGYYILKVKLTAKTGEFVYSDPVYVYVGDAEKGNILMNGEFDCGLTPWTLYLGGGAQATMSIDTTAGLSEGGAVLIDIVNGGTINYHVQFQQPVRIDKGHTYVLFFTAMSTQAALPVQICIQQSGSPYYNYFQVDQTLESPQEYGPFTYKCDSTDHAVSMRINVGNFNNTQVWFDDIKWFDASLTGLKDRKPLNGNNVPSARLLSRNYPNPFNPSTTILYRLPEEGSVSLILYNLKGQEVRTLAQENQKPGDHSVMWDGANGAGERVPSGVYVYQLKVKTAGGSSSVSRKIMLIE
jgi:hypothetical protein